MNGLSRAVLLLSAFGAAMVSLSCRTYLNHQFFSDDRSVESTEKHTLGFVEFDDQGWYHSRNQAQRVLERITAEASSDQERAIVVIFIHGWHHNACPGDENLACFRKTLDRLNDEVNTGYFKEARSRLGKPGNLRILGIYIGWRGRSLPGLLDYLTFWDRKAAGHQAGGADLREFLIRIGNLQKQLNEAGKFTGLVTIGHSFGGAVVENSLIQRVSRPLAENVPIVGHVDLRPIGRLLEGFGDLVVMINPAFEASLYNNIADLSGRATYSSEQSPILMTLSAENDGPRRTLFPRQLHKILS